MYILFQPQSTKKDPALSTEKEQDKCTEDNGNAVSAEYDISKRTTIYQERGTDPGAASANNFQTQKSSHRFGDISLHATVPSRRQTKLAINTPGDEYEEEADAIAEKIVGLTDTGSVQVKPSAVNLIRRKCTACEKEDEMEDEESETDDEGQPVLVKMIQRKCARCEEEEKKALQRKHSGNKAPVRNGSVQRALQGTGQPLDEGTRSYMEERFGFDFSKVQIHNSSLGHQSAKDINALAYTHKNNIVFGEGQYQPHTESGKRLLAHELTHTIQQDQSSSQSMIQKQEAPKPAKVERRVIIPPGLTTEKEFDRYAEIQIYGRVVNTKWEQLGIDVSKRVGVTVVYIFPAGELEQFGEGPGEKEKKQSASEYFNTGGKIRRDINKETDRRYHQSTGVATDVKIKPGETGSIAIWNSIRDKVMTDKRLIDNMPPAIKELMGGETNFKPEDYEQLLRIAEKLKRFRDEDFKMYKLLAAKLTGNLNVFEQSIDAYLERKLQMAAALDKFKKESKEETLEQKMEKTWEGFDGSKLATMSEDERYGLARQKTDELTGAQLDYMIHHPGETLGDFAKGATLLNTPDVAKGVYNDIKEAANGDANAFARWAGGVGAGAKISGWLAAVAGILYVASWFFGIGEAVTLAYIGITALSLLGASLVLSGTESELRIKAASQATDEKGFKNQTTKAAQARTTVIVGLALLALAIVVKALAKTLFPETITKIKRSITEFRDSIMKGGDLNTMKAKIAADITTEKTTLQQSAEQAKLECAKSAASLKGITAEELVSKLVAGDPELQQITGIKPGEALNFQELLKSPEGRAAIEQYKNNLTKILEVDAPAEIDKLKIQRIAQLDEFLKSADAAKVPDELTAALDKLANQLSEESLKTEAGKQQEQLLKQKGEAAKLEAALERAGYKSKSFTELESLAKSDKMAAEEINSRRNSGFKEPPPPRQKVQSMSYKELNDLAKDNRWAWEELQDRAFRLNDRLTKYRASQKEKMIPGTKRKVGPRVAGGGDVKTTGGTLAVGETDAALPKKNFEGASPEGGGPKVKAGVRESEFSPDNTDPRGMGHAEERVIIDFDKEAQAAIKSGALTEADLNGKTLRVHVETFPCDTCKSGFTLPENNGPLLKFLQKYKGMTLEITDAYSGETLRVTYDPSTNGVKVVSMGIKKF